MPVLPILKAPDEKLRKISTPVALLDIGSQKVQMLVENLFQTMELEHGVGIAAPQVGENIRVIIAERDGVAEAFVNPVLSDLSWLKTDSEEGCLSVPGIYGIVRRHRSAKFSAYDQNGQEVAMRVSGFFAIVLQHEIDHLDGVLFTDRVVRYIKSTERTRI